VKDNMLLYILLQQDRKIKATNIAREITAALYSAAAGQGIIAANIDG